MKLFLACWQQIKIRLQYILPQHLITLVIGYAARSRVVWLKNKMILGFIRHYQVDLSEAQLEDPRAYPSFNDFFIRRLKPQARPIARKADTLICPADGTLAQCGLIQHNRLLQAKNFYFDLEHLLGGDQELAAQFYHGQFATIYLAPANYHRVHLPFSGVLQQSIYVPGKLFSVNLMTSQIIPQLYSRNERFIAHFNTAFGAMVVILVGAMIVGHISMQWMNEAIRSKTLKKYQHPPLQFNKGDEIGYFSLGSTVILLFPPNTMQFSSSFCQATTLRMGQELGAVISRSEVH